MTVHTEAALGGRYRLDAKIATGGMGEVWRGMDVVLGRPVAVKVLRREYAGDHTFLERFRAEARNTASLHHIGVAQVFDYGQGRVNGAVVPYIVMELVPGEPLSMLVKRYGALTIDQALDVVGQTAQALQSAHDAGVIHRDIKPANLIVTPTGAVKVTDFGIARAADALPLTRTGTVMGTAHYLAPEMASGRAPASALSDIYALGVVLYECLCGSRPFPGDNPVQVALAHVNEEPPPLPASIPEPVRRLVARVMDKEPLNRPPTAGDLAARCAKVRADLSGTPTPTPTPGLAQGTPVQGLDWHKGPTYQTGQPTVAAMPGPGTAPTAPHEPRRAASGTSELALTETQAVTPLGGRRRARVDRGPGTLIGPRLAALIAALMLLTFGVVAVATRGTGTAELPDVRDLPSAQARATLEQLGFTVTEVDQAHATVPEGIVLSQTPVPGTVQPLAQPVHLVVSSGKPLVQVDAADWRGQPYRTVREELEGRGLVVDLQWETMSGTPGTVADIEPTGQLPVGSTVVVTVIKSPPLIDLGDDTPATEDPGGGQGKDKNGKGKD